MLVMAITIHNIPEGMAVGLAFSLAMSDTSDPALFSGAIARFSGYGIQNYPKALPCSASHQRRHGQKVKLDRQHVCHR